MDPRERLQIVVGKLFALFAFDVGYEIDLERLRRALGETAAGPAAAHKSPAAARPQYPSPPLVVPLRPRPLTVAGRPTEAGVTLYVHDFGVLSVRFDLPLPVEDFAELPALTAALATGGALELDARSVLREIFPRVAAAIARPEIDGHGLVEDYYVVQVSRFAPPVQAADLLGTHRDLVARTLHCEPAVLGPSEVDEVLRTAVSYTPDDLTVSDWNVALVYDEKYDDVLDVLELLNVQLLELRTLDAMLDRRIGELWSQVTRPRSRLLAFRREAASMRELSELRLDTAALRERTTNAIKLTGDLYLTKIYARTAERLHIGEWQRGIDGRLEVVQKISDVFTTRAATARAEILELTIVILIALEFVLFFFR